LKGWARARAAVEARAHQTPSVAQSIDAHHQPPPKPPTQTPVNDLYGRLFATWTLLTCGLCLICARSPTNPAIYGATLLSFVVALVHFVTELLVFKTMSIKGAASPMVVAGASWRRWVVRLWEERRRRSLVPRALTRPKRNKNKQQTQTGLSTLWMSAGWNYYTRDAAGLASPAASAETRPKEN
jgi:hypothetical protein